MPKYVRDMASRSDHNHGRSKKLISELCDQNSYETLDREKQRIDVIRQLDNLAQDWIKDIAAIRGICVSEAQELCGKLYTYGSYRLGVHDPETVMDTILIAPKIIQHNDFYDLFYQLLRIQPNITKCCLFNECSFHSIKMEFNGFGINLTLARLACEKIPDDFNPDTIKLDHLDAYSIRSIHGLQMTNVIINLVPNFKTFSISLRAIRIWARNCFIYSHTYGFLHGGALTILVANICRMFPDAAASKIVYEFFHIYSQADWNHPVILQKVKDLKLGLRMWNPRIYGEHREHVMSVITPVYPQQNLTQDVSLRSKFMITEELLKATNIITKIRNGDLPWSDLFRATNFFKKFQNFIVIKAWAPTLETHDIWSELVDSNINIFYKAWISCDYNTVCLINPIALKCQTQREDENLTYYSMWFISVEMIMTNTEYFGHLPTVSKYFRNYLTKVAFPKSIFDTRMTLDAHFVHHCKIFRIFGHKTYDYKCDNCKFPIKRSPEEQQMDEYNANHRLYVKGKINLPALLKVYYFDENNYII